jgi:hypothetical protein
MIFFCFMAVETTATFASADPASDRAAITERLQRWTAAFNARDAAGICDLFAPDLVSTVPETPDGNRDALCTRLNTPRADHQARQRIVRLGSSDTNMD